VVGSNPTGHIKAQDIAETLIDGVRTLDEWSCGELIPYRTGNRPVRILATVFATALATTI